jgi:hypothetical protein
MRKLKDNCIVRYRRIRGGLHPIVKFGLSYNDRTITVEAYADSVHFVQQFTK